LLSAVNSLRTVSELRRTPLYEQHVDLGAKIVPFAGWEMPVAYEGIREEHSAVRTHAGMFDVSHMGEVEVEGPAALAFLQLVLSNDVARLEIGGAQYSCLCQEDGGVIDDLFVYRLGGDRYLVVTNAANHEVDLAWLGRWSRGFDVIVRDVADRYAMLAVQGPHARAVLGRALAIQLPSRMHVAPVHIGRRPALACGTGYTGEDGVELLLDPEVATPIWAELLDAGVVPCGLGARDTLRLEVCFPLHGHELSTERNPIEAGLGWCCAEGTGFLGAHFDTTTGLKNAPGSYLLIAKTIALEPPDILFISDVEKELDAARDAGMQTALCVRTVSTERVTSAHHMINSFEGIFP